MKDKTAIIIGAGPAGLTAAHELLDKTDILPIIFEMSEDIGGIAKTVVHKGNRMDIGGHRFFTRSERVKNSWLNILPLQGKPAIDDIVLQRPVAVSKEKGAPDPQMTDCVMLSRKRLSRMLFLHTFFDYPISFSWKTFKNLGLLKTMRIGLSYGHSRMFPIREEKSLKDFFINRFGRELYTIFFKGYTEKVWGVPCSTIIPEWGAQRIQGLTARKALIHALKRVVIQGGTVKQEKSETSLIDRFLYPKLGVGQMWQELAEKVVEAGGEIHTSSRVVGLTTAENRVVQVTVQKGNDESSVDFHCDHVISTMPVQELLRAITPAPPKEAVRVSDGLKYRDFITVGVLLQNMKKGNETSTPSINNIMPDTWIYIQEPDIKIGRIQIYNNWSPYMVKDPATIWLGLEYFCNEGGELWGKTDEELSDFAVDELEKIEMAEKGDVLDTTVVRMKKAYPAYFGSYANFDVIREYTDTIENLYLIGRNGMHRYNNMDHSMLTAMTAVENIINGCNSKDNIWQVDTEN